MPVGTRAAESRPLGDAQDEHSARAGGARPPRRCLPAPTAGGNRETSRSAGERSRFWPGERSRLDGKRSTRRPASLSAHERHLTARYLCPGALPHDARLELRSL